MTTPNFKIDQLDHVAIRVADLEKSVSWYAKVLGLQKYQLPAWGPYPIFMLAGKTGIAIFPANLEDTKLDPASKNIKIDHFAFHVSQEELKKAKLHYSALGLDFTESDHTYFDSIYTKDPDGHTVELTAIKVTPESFYKS